MFLVLLISSKSLCELKVCQAFLTQTEVFINNQIMYLFKLWLNESYCLICNEVENYSVYKLILEILKLDSWLDRNVIGVLVI